MRRRCAVYKYPGARRGAPWRSRSQAPSRVCRAACADAPGVLWRRCRAPLNVYCPLQQAYLRLWLGILSNAPPDSGAARLRPFVEQATCPTGRANRGAATRPCDFHVCARTHAQGTRQSRHTTLHSATCTHVVSQTCLFLALAQPARRQPTAQAAQRLLRAFGTGEAAYIRATIVLGPRQLSSWLKPQRRILSGLHAPARAKTTPLAAAGGHEGRKRARGAQPAPCWRARRLARTL